MIIRPTELAGCYVVEPERHHDERGFFARSFAVDEFAAHDLNTAVNQVSVSYNAGAGTLRGLHYQRRPHEETKLVRCTRGRIFDVAVNLETRRWTAVELSEENGLGLYIPDGFAHGYVTLEPASEVLYLISSPYVPEASAGVRWDDPSLAVAWPEVGELTISERDRNLPTLR